jgi:polysaccharide biosynthesis transport protein
MSMDRVLHDATGALVPLAADAPAPAAVCAGVDEHLASVLRPQSYESDQYRVLRHFLEQARAARGLKVLAVTSPAAGDGKTITAINVAATLARSAGARVLLVDADLRRPLVAAKLGLGDPGGGLVGALLDTGVDVASAVRRTPFRLDVLPAGTPPVDAYNVLESPRMGQLIESARGSYDYVVVDTPPMLLVPDARLLSRWVDGFLVVVAAHRTPRALLADTLSAFEEGAVIGIVFNGDDRPLRGYSSYYGSYHAPRAAREPRWRRLWPFASSARRQGRTPW